MAKCIPRRLMVYWSYLWILVLLAVAAFLVFMDRTSWDHDKEKHLKELDQKKIEKEIEKSRLTNIAFDEVYKKEKQKPQGNPYRHKLSKAAPDCKDELNRTIKLHELWNEANKVINRDSLYKDDARADRVLNALATAKIVHVEHLDWGRYEKGISEKWLVTLEGGQKAMMKLDWEPENFGSMKANGLCNLHYELPSSEIAAFHLHKVLGFHNSVYVTGRVINLRREIIPVASQEVLKQISIRRNSVCIKGHYKMPKEATSDICPPGGIIKASLSYWVPRTLKLYTYPPKYMPFSTPNMDSWGIGLNNQTFCKRLQEDHDQPYYHKWYYHELFDFAVLDGLMHHYDSKHYVVYDDSTARGLTVRLDHGRAFCSHLEDYEDVMLAPIRQCCTMRAETYRKLQGFRVGALSAQWKASMDRDPLAPIMDDVWMEVIERRRTKILNLVQQCAKANNGLGNVLVQ